MSPPTAYLYIARNLFRKNGDMLLGDIVAGIESSGNVFRHIDKKGGKEQLNDSGFTGEGCLYIRIVVLVCFTITRILGSAIDSRQEIYKEKRLSNKQS